PAALDARRLRRTHGATAAPHGGGDHTAVTRCRAACGLGPPRPATASVRDAVSRRRSPAVEHRVVVRRNAPARDDSPAVSRPAHEGLETEGRTAHRLASARLVEPEQSAARAPGSLADHAAVDARGRATLLFDGEIAVAIDVTNLVAEGRVDGHHLCAVVTQIAGDRDEHVVVPVAGDVGEPDRGPPE